jgi:hypothetical protein
MDKRLEVCAAAVEPLQVNWNHRAARLALALQSIIVDCACLA